MPNWRIGFAWVPAIDMPYGVWIGGTRVGNDEMGIVSGVFVEFASMCVCLSVLSLFISASRRLSVFVSFAKCSSDSFRRSISDSKRSLSVVSKSVAVSVSVDELMLSAVLVAGAKNKMCDVTFYVIVPQCDVPQFVAESACGKRG